MVIDQPLAQHGAEIELDIPGRRLEAESKGLSDPRIEHAIEKSVGVPNGAIVILGGGDRGFAQDRAARQCRTDLAQKLATARPFGRVATGRFSCFGYISDSIFLIHCNLSVLAGRLGHCITWLSPRPVNYKMAPSKQ